MIRQAGEVEDIEDITEAIHRGEAEPMPRGEAERDMVQIEARRRGMSVNSVERPSAAHPRRALLKRQRSRRIGPVTVDDAFAIGYGAVIAVGAAAGRAAYNTIMAEMGQVRGPQRYARPWHARHAPFRCRPVMPVCARAVASGAIRVSRGGILRAQVCACRRVARRVRRARVMRPSRFYVAAVINDAVDRHDAV